MSFLRKWEVWLPLLIIALVAGLNASGIGPQIQLPSNYEPATLAAWAGAVLALWLPKILALLVAGGGGTAAIIGYNRRQIAGLNSEAAYYGAVRAGKIRSTPGEVADVVYTYTLADVTKIYDHVLEVLKQTLEAPPKNVIAANYFNAVQNYDIRPITERSERVPLMIALVDKAFELTKAAWEEFHLPVPSPEVCAAPARLMFDLKKAYQQANNQVCGDPVYDKMRSMLGDLNEIYQIQYGLSQMKDKTVDWSVLGWSSPVGIGLIREHWPKMV